MSASIHETFCAPSGAVTTVLRTAAAMLRDLRYAIGERRRCLLDGGLPATVREARRELRKPARERMDVHVYASERLFEVEYPRSTEADA